MSDRVDFESIFECLNEAGVRYVVVGGVAVVLRGVDRITADVDLVVDLTQANSLAAIEALLAAGFRAKIPVDPRGFADPDIRRSWITDKGMQVMSFWDPSAERPDVDLFVDYPLDFESLYTGSDDVALQRTHCRIASTEHLIRMKQAAGREKDLADIKALNDFPRPER
jgi:predicted nucleotidyltransferase